MAILIRLDRCFGAMLEDLELCPTRMERAVGLPDGFFHHPVPRLSIERYQALWDALVDHSGDPAIGQRLGAVAVHQGFETRRFTNACCGNLTRALQRSEQYTALTGQHVLTVHETEHTTTLRFQLRTDSIPTALGACVLGYVVELGRVATATDLRPLRITAPASHLHTFDRSAWYGAEIRPSEAWTVTLSAEDGRRPFVYMPPALMRFVPPHLRFDRPLPTDADEVQQARHVLLRSLPAGLATLDDVAAELGVSGRTLQRRLRDHNTSFQSLLDTVRLQLADHYLGTSRTPVEDIAFLVGYANAPSFYRAFQTWTGLTPEAYRDQVEDEAISA